MWSYKLGHAEVGDLIPVRYDSSDRLMIEIDGHAIETQRAAKARQLKEQAIASGEQELEQS